MGDERKAKCASCGAAILWIKDQNGTSIPLNATRARVYMNGNRRPEGGWFYEFVGDMPVLYHVSHFVTCPNAAAHSKRGKE